MEIWVNGVQFDSCIVGGELPVCAFGVIVATGCPCGDLSADFVDVADPEPFDFVDEFGHTKKNRPTSRPELCLPQPLPQTKKANTGQTVAATKGKT